MSTSPNRRHFIQSSLVFAATLSPAARAQTSNSPQKMRADGKKGYAIATRNPQWSRMVADLKAKWIYTWGAQRPQGLPEGVDWVPMIHRDNPANPADKALAHVKAELEAGHPLSALLGFNEPDQKNQANMTVEQALELWPKLEALGLPLGSPSGVHADSEWMQRFMKQAEKLKYRIDFVTVHWYGDPNGNQLMSHLDRVAKLYDRPLWITEFCPGDWSAAKTGSNKHGPKDVLKFIKDTLPRLERASMVQRYAWFSTTPDNAALSCSALFDGEGNLNPLGKAYAEIG